MTDYNPNDDHNLERIENVDNLEYNVDDYLLPIANVSRIMKKALPEGAKISKDAKRCVQECVSEFISFISGEASDRCKHEKRKTINGDDVIWALQNLGFDYYVEPLKAYLQKYRDQTSTSKKTSLKDMNHHSYQTASEMEIPHYQQQGYQYYVTHDQYRGMLESHPLIDSHNERKDSIHHQKP